MAAQAATLPLEVESALARAQVPREALSVVVADAEASRKAPRLAWQAQAPVNPASVMKLVTTYAALDQLGPAFTWNTPVYLEGSVQGGTLQGNAYIQGQGDPQLVMERLWLLLRRLQAQGVQAIAGDIVLDRSAFQLPAHDPGQFDGEPLRAYNAAPDALLINYQALTLTFVPDAAAGLARVMYDPPLAGMQLQPTVPLALPGTACGDWRAGLRAEREGARIAFQGAYPAACGERPWSMAPVDAQRFAARAVEGMWRALGGRLSGQVRDGRVPAGLQPVFSQPSLPLGEVVRSVNKFSNNVMAQQIFLTLGLQKGGAGSFDAARAALRQWWQRRVGDDAPVLENGAGLSRSERISAQALARMLQAAWASPVMPELLASLPIAGMDGTLRRSQSRATAHLKTGSLRDVAAIAGYVDGAHGHRWVLVAVINHANAAAARPALDALVDWAAHD